MWIKIICCHEVKRFEISYFTSANKIICYHEVNCNYKKFPLTANFWVQSNKPNTIQKLHLQHYSYLQISTRQRRPRPRPLRVAANSSVAIKATANSYRNGSPRHTLDETLRRRGTGREADGRGGPVPQDVLQGGKGRGRDGDAARNAPGESFRVARSGFSRAVVGTPRLPRPSLPSSSSLDRPSRPPAHSSTAHPHRKDRTYTTTAPGVAVLPRCECAGRRFWSLSQKRP